MQGTMPGARRRGRPRTAWMDIINRCTGLSVEESIRMTEDRDKMEKVHQYCGQPSDRGRLKQNRYHQVIIGKRFPYSAGLTPASTSMCGFRRGAKGPCPQDAVPRETVQVLLKTHEI